MTTTRMDLHTLLYLAASALILLGLAGAVLPVLPGPPLAFAGMLLAAWTDDFRVVSVAIVLVLAALTAIAVALDVIAGLLGARLIGASRLAIVGAALGTLAGMFFWLPGLLIGPFAGAALGEWLHSRDTDKAVRVGFGAGIGTILGAVFKLVVTFAMLGVFLAAIAFS